MALSLKQMIAQNAADIVSASGGAGTLIADEQTRAEGIEGGLRTDVDAASADILTNKDIASAYTDAETSRAVGIEDANKLIASNYTDAEQARAQGAEGVLQTNIDAEGTARVLLESKVCFAHCLEFEGVMLDSVNQYPFCAGMGTPSSLGYGVSVPVDYEVVGWSLTCFSTDVTPSVELILENVAFGTVTVESVDVFSMSSTKYIARTIVPVQYTAGNLTVRCGLVTGCTDPDARYRLCLYMRAFSAF